MSFILVTTDPSDSIELTFTVTEYSKIKMEQLAPCSLKLISLTYQL
jgi:hypothetical protein